MPDASRNYPVRTSENSPSTHSGELMLGTWLLQQPTHRDHGPTEHGRDASALQLHLKDLQTLQSTISRLSSHSPVYPLSHLLK
jgi:hypothetical protein